MLILMNIPGYWKNVSAIVSFVDQSCSLQSKGQQRLGIYFLTIIKLFHRLLT